MLRFTFLASLLVLLGGLLPSRAAEPLAPVRGAVLLSMTGKIEQTNAPGRAEFDQEMLESLGRRSFKATFVFGGKQHLFEGVSLRAVLERAGAKGATIRASSWNGYEVNIPWDGLKDDPLIAVLADGRTLTLRDKGPLWIVYPRDDHSALRDDIHDSRWVWQLNRLQILQP